MILRRLSANLRAQNWTAIAVEFVMVVLGVFFGILAANWNVDRLEKKENADLLGQLDEELTIYVRYIDGVKRYYVSAGGYADRAAAGWSGDRTISDSEFVIAAYQASQVNGMSNDGDVWSAIFGAEQLRSIADPAIRRNLARVMTFDRALVDLRSVATRYREEVRKTIPNAVQAAIREQCGDRDMGGGELMLPPRCDLQLPATEAASVARALRARPELLAELQWHRAAVANQVYQGTILQGFARALTKQIGPSP